MKRDEYLKAATELKDLTTKVLETDFNTYIKGTDEILERYKGLDLDFDNAQRTIDIAEVFSSFQKNLNSLIINGKEKHPNHKACKRCGSPADVTIFKCENNHTWKESNE